MTEKQIIDLIYTKTKQYLNNGIADVHLSKGCIGELCLIDKGPEYFSAVINVWQKSYSDFAELREVFKLHGAKNVCISQTLDDESNFITNGFCEDTGREIIVGFKI